MILSRSLKAFGSEGFAQVLKEEVSGLGSGVLPLQQGLRTGSNSLDGGLEIMVLRSKEAPAILRVRIGIFYQSIVAGCACADDPTPVNENTEYCEVDVEIDRRDGRARFNLVDDGSSENSEA
ncbi:glucosamine--fructose-6-phosphate aminotransferase [Ectothiorhodospira haloalkaliphila]|uniref:Glucosamine--fructose-6-phosphate aminotransferase n=1 Tax=Ectothiorhodospira haloalkaliphila TaxID=421628 RepID=W8KGA4_9GAMM|nr:glucosamine--fructose-6-phosphate aminotransferase [Ectothiorhodospira haloalkaliphila]